MIVLSNGFRPYPGKVNAVRSVWFGYVTVAAEYGQDIFDEDETQYFRFAKQDDI